MPSIRIEYKILLSSPSDVEDERQVAVDLVAEINKTWAQSSGATLRLLRWEDVAPDFSSDPQMVINSALGEDWDIYLGIMHARFGSPTKRFGSGTEEEFLRAHDLWLKDQDRRKLMFYFKRAAVAFNEIDPEQVSKVRAFQAKIEKLGGLYKYFTDTPSFRDLLRAHLTTHLSELHKRNTVKSDDRIVVAPTASLDVVEPPDGILDLAASGIEGMQGLTSVLVRIGAWGEVFRREIDQNVEQINNANKSADLPALRSAVTALSKTMSHNASKLAAERREYSSKSRPAFEALSTAISMAKASAGGAFDSKEFGRVVSEAADKAQSFVASLVTLEQEIQSLPHIARDFTTARILFNRELSLLRNEVNGSIGLMRELVTIAGSG